MKTCKICRSTDVKVLVRLHPKQGGECDALGCRHCGLVWAHPLPDMTFEFLNRVYGDEYTEEYRVREEDEYAQQILCAATMRQMDKVEAMLPGVGCALNVGAMTVASRVLVDRGWDLTIVEVSEYAAQLARKKWGFHILAGRIEDVALPHDYFDFVKLGHVIEHLADPMLVLRKLWNTLRPGGLLLVETDNAGSLKTWVEVTVRRILGEALAAQIAYWLTGKNLRKRYGRLLPYEHICLFRSQTLNLALETTNFDIVDTLYPPQGDPTWFPFTTQVERWSRVERFMSKVDQVGARFGAGEVLVVFARKPDQRG